MGRSPDEAWQLVAAGRNAEAGRLFEATARIPEAIQAYRRGAAWAEAARLLAQEQHFEDAGDCMLRLLPARPTPVDQLNPLQRRAAGHAAMFYARAGRLRLAVGLFMNLGEHERAAEFLRRAGRREDSIRAMRGLPLPDSPWRPGTLSSNLYGREAQDTTGEVRDDPLALADARARKGQYPEALEILLKVSADAPRYPEAVARAVRLAGAKGLMSLKVDRFVGPFLKGSGGHVHGPVHVPTLYLLGRLYEDMDFDEEAEVAYDAVLAVDRGYRDAASRRRALARPEPGGRDNLERALADDLAWVGGPASELPATKPTKRPLPRPVQNTDLQAQVDSRSLELGLGPLGVGSVIADRYQVEGALGEGGYAVVFQVTDMSMEEEIALKLFARGGDPRGLDRFKQEMRITRRLAHPNIVQVYEFGTWREARFITMELLCGDDLHALLAAAGGPLPIDQALDYAAQALAGLGEAHQRGVVHRDVKPRNLFVCDDGRLKVMDFGIAKGGDALEQQHTATGQVVGTPAYIPPERLRSDEDELGPSVDLYAMGVCLYRMLTGVLPFAARHVETLFMKILDEEPAPPSVLNPAVPPALDRLVLKLLEKDPGDRYGSCEEASAAVEALR